MDRPASRIVIVAHHYPPHLSGVGLVAQGQAQRLAALGYRVSVVTSKTHTDETSGTFGGIRVVRVPAWNISELWGAPFPIFSPTLITSLVREVRAADIVHIHDAFYMSSFFAALVAKIFRKPLVLTQHIAMVAHPSRLVIVIQKIVYATTGAFIFRMSDIIFTFNDRVERFLLARNVPASKLSHLPNGVDTDLFHPVDEVMKRALRSQLDIGDKEKVILFVGRPVPKKGFEKVLAACDDGYRILCAAGEIPAAGRFRGNVTFLDRMSQERLAELYQASDIFLLPSESEGFPLSVQEAMACGLPVITTNDEGYERYHFDGNFIFLLDRPDGASVRAAVRALVADDARLRAMGAYSEQYAKANFGWQTIIGTLRGHYERLIS